MANLLEVTTTWTAENAQPGTTVMYFFEVGDIAALRADLDAMYTAFADRLDTLTTWSIATSGNVLDEATGTLVGDWAEPTAQTGAGLASGQPVSNAAQALLQWRTGVVVNGRRLRGRTFIPGIAQQALDGGQLSAATQADMAAAAQAFAVDPDVSLVVWHRPSDSGPGEAHAVTTGSVWNELAVMRKRR